MVDRKTTSLLLPFAFLLSISSTALAQTQTTGRITGFIADHNGAAIVGAEALVVSKATGEQRAATSDATGNYAVTLLRPGTYRVSVVARGFDAAIFDNVQVVISETTSVNAQLAVAGVTEAVAIQLAPLIQRDGPQMGRVVDSRAVAELPLATRNFTQILGLSPGTSVDLPDSTAVGRNSQNISVNGARSTQNNFQINGVFALSIHTNSTTTGGSLAVPAPETIQ